MNILLIPPHGAGDVGAVGVRGLKESEEVRSLVEKLKTKFGKNVNVGVYPTNRNAFADLQNTGKFAIDVTKYDYVLEPHFNAFNGTAHGTECYVVYAEKGITVEQKMMKALSKYFKLRDNDAIFDGVKRSNFLVINTLKQMGVSACLLETCFIDNVADMQTYEEKKEQILEDVAKAIVEAFGLEHDVVPTPVPTPTPVPPKPTNKPNQILEVGSKVKFYEKLYIDKINYVPNVIDMCHIPYLGGWVNSSIVTEDGGNNAIDQILQVGSTCTIKGIFTVNKVNAKADTVFLKELGFWVQARALEEVANG